MVDIHHPLPALALPLVVATHDVTDAVHSVSKNTTTHYHRCHGVCPLIFGDGHDFSISHSAHGGKGPIQTCDILGGKVFIYERLINEPASVVGPQIVHTEIKEEAAHVMSNDDNFHCNIEKSDHQIH